MTTNSSSSNNNNNNEVMIIQRLQSKAKDMEQRLSAAMIQQQQMTSSHTPTGTTSHGRNSKNQKGGGGSTTVNPTAEQQQQQMQQISKNINRYRMVLCETYADWILTSPYSAQQPQHSTNTNTNTTCSTDSTVLHALWRSCFYGRIGPARIRIQKEQRKYDALMAAAASTAAAKSSTANDTAMVISKNTTAATAAAAASLRQQKESLSLFLTEGITLYDYLCQTLQHQLRQQQQLQVVPVVPAIVVSSAKKKKMNNAANTSTTGSSSSNTTNHNGIVPCLYRLYIHLGDLHRYGSGIQLDSVNPSTSTRNSNSSSASTGTHQHHPHHSTTAAQLSYTMAMRFGPAHGHAYNQLAVIYQMKDTTTTTTTTTTATTKQSKKNSMGNSSTGNSNNNTIITTVYWYTRSLGASREPFVTAASNLVRLLDTNRQWLLSQQEQQQSPARIKILVRPGSSTSTGKSNTNNEKQEMGKVVAPTNQNMTSRFCLATFVDVQYSFYTMAQTNRNEKQQQQQQPMQLRHQIRTMLTSIHELLSNASLSDPLLCKLITIMSFMEYHCYHHSHTTTTTSAVTNNNNATGDNMRVRVMFRIMMYEFGTCLAQRVLATLTNKIQKQQQQQQKSSAATTTTWNVPSIRVILPLLLITEYFLQNNNINTSFATAQQQDTMKMENDVVFCDSEEREQYNNVYTSFWKTIIDVYNTIVSLDCIVNTKNENDSHCIELREYQELRGFAPFESFLQPPSPTDADPHQQQQHHGGTNDTYLTETGYLSDSAAIHMMDTVSALDHSSKYSTFTSGQHHHLYQTKQESNRTTSQASGSTNMSVSSSTTNNSITNKEMVLIKVRRFIALRSTLVSRLQRHVRVHPFTDTLEWSASTYNFYIGETDRMQYNSNNHSIDVLNNEDDDDGGDCIIGMHDENEGTMQLAIDNLVADDENNYASTAMKNHSSRTSANESDDVLLMYQRDESNNGPALLVPGALLFQTSLTPQATVTDRTVHHPPGLPPPLPSTTTTFGGHNAFVNTTLVPESTTGSTITPPPGFATTTTTTTNTIDQDLIMNITSEPLYHTSNQWHPSYGTEMPNKGLTTTIGESKFLFGGSSALHTSNPFAATTNASRLYIGNPAIGSSSLSHDYLPSYSLNDTDMIFGSMAAPSDDDPLLFNSGLLKSLLMEETTTGGLQQQQHQATTKNPFV